MRCVFLACPAFLGRVDGETRCGFWTQEPVDHGFDPRRLIDVDLALTPSAAAAGQIGWDQVQVDDCLTAPAGQLSGSTLGPRWPELHLAGAVSLECDYAASLPQALRPRCPPMHTSPPSLAVTMRHHPPSRCIRHGQVPAVRR